MKRIISLAVAASSLLVLCMSVLSPIVNAAAPSAGYGQALEIAPPLITLTANPGQTIKTDIKLRDVSGGKLLVTNQINDFTAAGEDGTPKILTGSDDNNYAFGMKNWVTPLPNQLLSPNQIVNMPVTIAVPRNASPGGHYGVVRFTGTAPGLSGSGVALTASIGSLILLTVNGNIQDNLSVQGFSVNNGNGKATAVVQSTPVQFVVQLKNTGDIQEQPSGHIIVTDMFGKAVAGMIVNAPPRDILPDSTRKFTTSLDKTVIGNKRLFGRYTAELDLSYGYKTNKTIKDTISFWVIPYELIAIIIILLIVVFFVLRYLIKRYNQNVIKRAQKVQQKQKQKPQKKSKRK
jgi:hypothetical protein